MERIDLAGKRLAVLGAGREGAATARWLLGHGHTVTVCEQKADFASQPVYQELTALGAGWVLGGEYLAGLTDYDVVFRSPGLPYLSPEIQAAKPAGVAVSSQTKLFFGLCPAPIIGISGTKGKGTTAGLVSAMLTAAGRSHQVGGNIGTPPLDFLDGLKPSDLAVLELSSFQLQDLACSPHVAVVTNLTADHLDHHRSIAEYRHAKESLLAHQSTADFAILNAEDAGSRQLEGLGQAKRWHFAAPRHATPGAYIENGNVVLHTGSSPVTVCRVTDILLPGRHNQQNVLAACLAASAVGVPVGAMAEAIRSYRGLPHHLELVATKQGVRYFDDSYATNPTAAIPAIESFSEPVILIAGGHDKGLEYTELARVIARSTVKAVVLIPPVGNNLAEALQQEGDGSVPVTFVQEKAEIVPAALAYAEPGDAVLLSPAAASFGMFGSYVERGEYFSGQAQGLPD